MKTTYPLRLTTVTWLRLVGYGVFIVAPIAVVPTAMLAIDALEWSGIRHGGDLPALALLGLEALVCAVLPAVSLKLRSPGPARVELDDWGITELDGDAVRTAIPWTEARRYVLDQVVDDRRLRSTYRRGVVLDVRGRHEWSIHATWGRRLSLLAGPTLPSWGRRRRVFSDVWFMPDEVMHPVAERAEAPAVDPRDRRRGMFAASRAIGLASLAAMGFAFALLPDIGRIDNQHAIGLLFASAAALMVLRCLRPFRENRALAREAAPLAHARTLTLSGDHDRGLARATTEDGREVLVDLSTVPHPDAKRAPPSPANVRRELRISSCLCQLARWNPPWALGLLSPRTPRARPWGHELGLLGMRDCPMFLRRTTAIMALCCSCSACRQEQRDVAAERDSGVAVGPVDDTMVSSPVDAPPVGDSAVPDVGPDSPLSRGHSVGLPAFPDCPPTIASDPADAIAPLTWTACTSARTGCTTLKVDWDTRTDDGPIRRASYPGIRIVGGKPYFAHTRYSHDWLTGVIERGFDGPVVFGSAFSPASPIGCAVNASLGGAGLGIIAFVTGKSRPAGVDNTPMLGAGALETPSVFKMRFVDKSEFGVLTSSGDLNDLIVGDNTAFGITYLPTAVQPFDLTLLKPVHSANSSVSPVVVPDGVLASDLTSNGLQLIRPNGTFATWVAPILSDSGSRAITAHDFDQTTRDRVAWIEVDASTGSDAVLWTAPYVGDAAKVVPREVGKLSAIPSGGRGMVLNDGYVLVTSSKTRLSVIRLSDGSSWNADSEAAFEFDEPLWLDSDEVVALLRPPGGLPSSILRLKRTALVPGSAIAP